MKVAIIGAGVSGLACAYGLSRHGVCPDIFERKSRVGDLPISAAIHLNGFDMHLKDGKKYFEDKYNLKFNCLADIKKITIKTKRKKLSINGRTLGEIYLRGVSLQSLENQFYRKVKAHIKFNCHIEPEDIYDIKREYDYVVAAAGDKNFANIFDIWTDTFTVTVRAAIALGEFNSNEVFLWINNEYTNNGIAYLIPENEKKASITLMVNGATHQEMDYYWSEFIRKESIRYIFTEIRDFEHSCGILSKHQCDNIFFVGNGGGFTGDLIGIGMMYAIESGIGAANSILYGKNYEKEIKKIASSIKKLHEIRKLLNTFNNANYDILLILLKMPIIKQLIYNNPFFRYRYLGNAAKTAKYIKNI